MIERVLFDPFALPYMERALIELLLLSSVGALVGIYVVFRRLAFLTETLQHTVFPGIALAFVAGQSLLLGAAAAALLTIVLFTYIARRPRVDQDSALALLISLFFATGVVLVSTSGGYQHDLTALLFGRILAVDSTEIVQTVVVGVVVVATMALLHKELVLRAFDPAAAEAAGYRIAVLDLALNLMVAAVVVVAVQAVGTVLLVAFIVTPAAAARLACRRILPMMAFAAVLAMMCSWIGLGLSYDLSITSDVTVPAGAMVVVCITAAFVLVAVSTWVSRRAARLAARSLPAVEPA